MTIRQFMVVPPVQMEVTVAGPSLKLRSEKCQVAICCNAVAIPLWSHDPWIYRHAVFEENVLQRTWHMM